MKLICAVCGQWAGNYKQWLAQDRGYGICVRCVLSVLAHDGPDETRKSYGVAGVHYENPIDAAPESAHKAG